jgi:hypothetical protein
VPCWIPELSVIGIFDKRKVHHVRDLFSIYINDVVAYILHSKEVILILVICSVILGLSEEQKSSLNVKAP